MLCLGRVPADSDFHEGITRGNAGGLAKLSFKSWVNQVVLAKLLTLWTHC